MSTMRVDRLFKVIQVSKNRVVSAAAAVGAAVVSGAAGFELHAAAVVIVNAASAQRTSFLF